MFIDPHVHCRDDKQSYKETIAHALSVAERVGMSAIFDMPNTEPPIFSLQQALERIELAKKVRSPVFYGLHVGLSADVRQIENAVKAYDMLPEVVGFKMFAGHSTGNLGVTDEKSQQFVYDVLEDFGYTGVIAVHCEKESLMKPHLWNPLKPVSHSVVRSPEAEVASVTDQVSFCTAAGFKGNLHVAHISVPAAVDIVQKAKRNINITSGVCPHHCVLNTTHLEKSLLFKTNPPLRVKSMADQMFDYLCSGQIDWVETDHAPHLAKEKLNEPYLSGIPGLPFYPRFVEKIRQRVSKQQLFDITFGNIKKTFGVDINQRMCEPQFDLGKEYDVDVYHDL